MYSKIVNPLTNKYVNINSNLGKDILKKYRYVSNLQGGVNKILTYEPTNKYDWVKNMPLDGKKSPHYIKEGKCIKITHDYTPLLRSGTNKTNLTLLERIRIFYSIVFKIRKGLVDVKTNKQGFVYDNKIRCELFLDMDSETPDRFKQSLDKFNLDIKNLFLELNTFKTKIQEEIIDVINVVEQKSNHYNWEKDNLVIYAEQHGIAEKFNTIKYDCLEIIDYINTHINQLHFYNSNVNSRADSLFNNDIVHIPVSKLTKIFYDMIYYINNFYDNKFDIEALIVFNEDIIFIEDHNYFQTINMYIDDLKRINTETLTEQQVLEL